MMLQVIKVFESDQREYHATKGPCLMQLIPGARVMRKVRRYERNDPGAYRQKHGIGERRHAPGKGGDAGEIGAKNQACFQSQPWAIVGMCSPCPAENLVLKPHA